MAQSYDGGMVTGAAQIDEQVARPASYDEQVTLVTWSDDSRNGREGCAIR